MFHVFDAIIVILVLIVTFTLVRLIFKKKWKSHKIRIPASILIGFVGLFWFIERVLNL